MFVLRWKDFYHIYEFIHNLIFGWIHTLNIIRLNGNVSKYIENEGNNKILKQKF